jgi:hypothetical protein
LFDHLIQMNQSTNKHQSVLIEQIEYTNRMNQSYDWFHQSMTCMIDSINEWIVQLIPSINGSNDCLQQQMNWLIGTNLTVWIDRPINQPNWNEFAQFKQTIAQIVIFSCCFWSSSCCCFCCWWWLHLSNCGSGRSRLLGIPETILS